MLPDGKVLVSGGKGSGGVTLPSAEIYDPALGTWTSTGAMSVARALHTATGLPDGGVLVTGGLGLASAILASSEVYESATGTWRTTSGALSAARYLHTATLLQDGTVIASGGLGVGVTILAGVERYDPATDTWATTGGLASARYLHTATVLPNGDVLATGGVGAGFTVLGSAERYAAGSGSWSATGALTTPRLWHRAVLLPSGQVLVLGGIGSGILGSAEVYDPDSGAWTATAGLATARYLHTATLLPNGKVLAVGGWATIATAELYDAAQGSWTGSASLGTPRSGHTATLLSTGRLLVAGGTGPSGPGAAAELYDPVPISWTSTGSLIGERTDHSATLLADGTVLVAGGSDGTSAVASAEIYDPATETWSQTGALSAARFAHTATRLASGAVLVAGGKSGGTAQASAELYDPATGSWTAVGGLHVARFDHSATLLPDGRVLVAGGSSGSGALDSTETFAPSAGVWSPTGRLAIARSLHTATLLPRGHVLVTGGWSGAVSLNATERFDPGSGSWVVLPSMATARSFHAAALLPGGDVIVAGGLGAGPTVLDSTERFDPATARWTTSAPMATPRYDHAATLLRDGRTAVSGGAGSGATRIAGTEHYDEGRSFAPSWRPTLSTVTSPVSLGASLVATGAGFRSRSESSGGDTQGSSSNYPLIQLRSLVNDQTQLLTPAAAGWTDASFTSHPLSNLPLGPALVTVLTNGVPSASLTTTVTANTTTTLGTHTPDPSPVGAPVMVTYTVAWAGGTPTGTVSVGDGTNSCSGSVAAGGCVITFTTTGTKNLTASYTGTGGFNASLSSSVQHTVIQGAATTTIASHTPSPSALNQVVRVGYAVTAAAGTPTGTVTVSTNGAETCAGTVAAGGCDIALTSSGVRILTATYAGDQDFAGGVSAGVSHSVVGLQTTTTITSHGSAPSPAGQPITVTYTVTSASGGPPTGTVTVSDGTDSCSATVAAGGCAVTLTTPGARTLTATYAGDATFAASISIAISHEVSACTDITVAPTAIAAAVLGTAYQAQAFDATGGQPPVALGLSGTLPAGMSFVSGTLSGTPTEAGSFPFTVTATDTTGCTGGRAYEFAVNPHVLTYALAEGATGPFFDAYLLMANPNGTPAPVTVTFMTETGTTIVVETQVEPQARYTLPFESVPALVVLGSAAVATTVTSTSGVPLIVEGSAYWDATAFGGAAAAGGVASPTWYFAEGSEAVRDSGAGVTSFFDTYLLFGNATVAPATVSARFMTEEGTVVTRAYTVPARSRLTVSAGAIPELDDHSFGIVVTSDVPISAARTQYFGPDYTGGHAASGVTSPATTWLFADGASGPFFDTYLLLANPNAGPAQLTLTYTLSSGAKVTRWTTVPGNTRVTRLVDTEDPALDNDTFWVEVRSDLPVAAERAMYWRSPFTSWTGGHASPGTPQAGTRWGLAEGMIGGALDFETYLILVNPGVAPAEVEVTFLRANGSPLVRTHVLPPSGRETIKLNTWVPELLGESFGMVLRSTNAVPFVAERSMCWTSSGTTFGDGTNVPAVPLP